MSGSFSFTVSGAPPPSGSTTVVIAPVPVGVAPAIPVESAANAKPVARDIALDVNTSQIGLTSTKDLGLVYDKAAIRQTVLMKLRTFQGEWFLDKSVGVPYFQEILGKNAKIEAITAVFSDAILEVPGVRSLLKFSVNMNQDSREIRVQFRVDTDLGELVVAEVL